MWFHSHKWEIAGVDYVPPLATFNFKAAGQDVIDRAMCGQSVVHLRCSVCGDISQRRVLGKFEWTADKQNPVAETK
jgi:hypothetical protein